MSEWRFGKVQLRIMQVLWEQRSATARDITTALNESNPIAHSTVQTLLRKLEDKGAVTHDAANRVFVFRPLVAPARVRKKATREFINGLFNGSPVGLASYLIKNERIRPEELEELRRLIREKEEKKS